jgi:hypothetical protein
LVVVPDNVWQCFQLLYICGTPPFKEQVLEEREKQEFMLFSS